MASCTPPASYRTARPSAGPILAISRRSTDLETLWELSERETGITFEIPERPMTTTRVDRAALVRRALVELVAERGFRGTSMGAVAERAGRGNRHRLRALRLQG